MPQSCVAFNCTVRHRKGDDIKFHSFPKSGKLRDEWISALCRANFVPSSHSRVCSSHFLENDYETNVFGNKTLKRDAIPSKFSFERIRHNNAKSTSNMNTLQSINNSEPVQRSTEENVLTDEQILSPIAVQSCSNVQETLPATSIRKRKRSIPIYVGDFVEEDLNDPVKRKKYWNISQSTISSLRKSNKKNTTILLRYKKKIKTLADLLSDFKKRFQISSESSIVLKECIPEAEKQLIERQLRGTTGKFPPELRSFALTLNFYSSAAYNFMRKHFGKNCLPHPNTLSKWCSSVDGSPGYTSEAIRAVKIKVEIEQAKGKKLIAGLIMDEMSIKEHVEWTGSRLFNRHTNS